MTREEMVVKAKAVVPSVLHGPCGSGSTIPCGGCKLVRAIADFAMAQVEAAVEERRESDQTVREFLQMAIDYWHQDKVPSDIWGRAATEAIRTPKERT